MHTANRHRRVLGQPEMDDDTELSRCVVRKGFEHAVKSVEPESDATRGRVSIWEIRSAAAVLRADLQQALDADALGLALEVDENAMA